MRRFLQGICFSALVALFLYVPATAQVRQSGNVTQGHVACWTTTGAVQDCGTAAISYPTTFGVTNNGGPGICLNSAQPSSGSYNQLCFAASTAAAAVISLQNYGSASPQSLNLSVNGTLVGVPTGGGSTFLTGTPPFTVNGIPAFSSTGGTIVDSGLQGTGGAVTTGAWQATPVALGFGGTGGTSAATARTGLGLGTVATQDASAIALTGGTITGLGTPTVSSDAATKGYVDGLAAGLRILAPSVYATAAVLPQTPTYANGASGVGATLTAGSNAALVVDGVTVTSAQRILVKDQAAPAQNGIYTVTTVGSGGAAWVLTRATDFDTAAEMLVGSYTFVTAGNTNVNSSWVLQATVTTVGSTAATFYQFSSSNTGVSSLNSLTGGLNITGAAGVSVSASVSTVALTTTGGVDVNTLNSQVANYTIAAADCGKTVQAGTGSTGIFTVTLPSVSGFSGTCTVTVVNGDSARGKVLSGFPTGTQTILWPKQTIIVKIINGAWATTEKPGRYRLTAATTVYFNQSAGSNSNDGLAAGASNAFATLQFAWDTAATQFDLAGQTLTIQAASGQTYTTGLTTSTPMVGSIGATGVIIDGGTSTFSLAGAYVFELGSGVGAPGLMFTIQNLTCTNSVGGCIDNFGAVVNVAGGVIFGTVAGSHMKAAHPGAQIFVLNNYTIAGNAAIHFDSETGGLIVTHGLTAACTGGAAYTFTIFAYAAGVSNIYAGGMTFASCGLVTGTRYAVYQNANVDVSAGGANYFPGNVAGAAALGGQYN